MEGVGPYINPETRNLLRLMQYRVIGILHFELLTNVLTEKEYRALLEKGIDDPGFTLLVGKFFASRIRESTHARRIAPRLLPELVSIFWAHVVDCLLQHSVCDLKNFGEFRVNRASGATHIDFTPSPLVAEPGSEELFVPLRSPYRSETLMHQICHPALASARQELLRGVDFPAIYDWRLPLIGTTYIANALETAWINAFSTQDLTSDPGDDSFALLAMTSSVVTYYGWAMAFAFELHAKSKVEMPDIGLFQKRALQVEFTPASGFLKLLVANLPPLVKGIAA